MTPPAEVPIETIIATAAIDVMGVWHLCIFFALCLAVIGGLKKLPLTRITKVLWGYALLYALVLFEFPYPFFGVLSHTYKMAAGQSFAEMLLIPLLVLFFPKPIARCIPFAVAFEIASLWYSGRGFMRSPSFDTAFIALCSPFIPAWLWGIGFVTIGIHHGSTAWMILGAQLVGFLLAKKKWKWVLGLSPVAGVAVWFTPHHSGFLWGADSRIQVWQRYMGMWASSPNSIAFGQGPGSFMWHSLRIDQWRDPLFYCMHCDWLQLTFTFGLIGLVLFLSFVGESGWKVRRDALKLAAIFGAVTFGLTYHPLEFAPSAIVTALIFRRASIEDEVNFNITRA